MNYTSNVSRMIFLTKSAENGENDPVFHVPVQDGFTMPRQTIPPKKGPQMAVTAKPVGSHLKSRLEQMFDQRIENMGESELRRFERKAEKIVKSAKGNRRSDAGAAHRGTA